MPTYLCHGFRWYRRSIRIFIILNDLEDCTPDWIIGRDTAALILSQFAESFDFVPRLENEDGTVTRPGSNETTPTREKQPQSYDDDLAMPVSKVPAGEDSVLVHEWSPVKLLEEYHVDEAEHAARPYAYVADHVVRVDLGVDIVAEMARYEDTVKQTQSQWFEQLRAQVQAEEQSRWYVVVCDDTDREAPESYYDGGGGELPEMEAARQPQPQPQPQPRPGVISRTGTSSMAGDRLDSGDAGGDSLGSRPDVPTQPTFLGQDPFKKELPPTPRLKKKLSIRRLFSKKDP
ncbi:hypothetical protein J3458_020599 [Metarhizium acridum]|uniref:Uncharacterized protein n=1 Tax=Metarhizium acridum (strain CQMa 102) TaxID=655827 RepID=E9ED19_METAQ|nr:uncharacterized protein MAC_07767 [Metarhizium acridum CQMa 102]EFY86175.1 hypothetical protein MAC_07767 [Metarhizium acridum CQMa 102]KAG8407105.1 hypothetical protein J3458_020599 [Metarhizium acridum]